MTGSSGFVLFYGALCALLLVIVRSIRFVPDGITPFELRRRVAAGDPSGVAIRRRLDRLPRLIALQRIVEVLLIIGVGASLTLIYGWIVGGFLAVLAVALGDVVAAVQAVRRPVQNLVRRHESRLIDLVDSWRWLDALKVPVATPDDVAVSSKTELVELIKRSHGILSGDEQQQLHRTLMFNASAVQDIMTPRSMIDSIEASEVIGPLVLDQLHKTGHSRIPVIEGDIDHVVGMLYVRDLVSLGKAAQHRTIADAMRPEVFYIHESKHLEHALHSFLRTHHHLCIVVNEFRETVGLLTLEDVIEALLGRRIVDEFDEFEDIRKVADSNPHSNNEPKGKKDL